MTPSTEFTASRENGRRRPRGYADWRPQARTRALLDQVEEVFDRYGEHLPLTIRQVYYALVAAGHIDKTEAAYSRLCEHLGRARRAKLIPFDFIRDDGISVMATDDYSGIADFDNETSRRARTYRRDRQAGQPMRVELWCEASGMMGQLARVATEYSIPVYSNSGFASLSAVRAIAQRAIARDVPTVILHVGDFDPSGESVFEAVAQDAAAFVRTDRVIQPQRIDAVRVALTAEQVAAWDLPTSPAKATDSRSRAWEGGTCQLEALPPDVLARIVEDAIAEHFDLGVLERVLAAEHADRSLLLGLPSGEES